jgi:hypothetical protein
MTEIVSIEFVEYDPQRYDLFGKVVARIDVRSMSEAAITLEVDETLDIIGRHCTPIRIEEV